MKDVPVSYKKGLLAGLRPDSKMGRGTENLVTCVGVYPKAGSLSDLENETFIDVSSLACTFPYPQYFELSGCTLVCTPTAIYSYSSGVLTEEISGLTADNLWTLADFNSYIFLTNGTETVIRNPETGEFIAINNQETPPAECVCGTSSQIIYGGPDMTMLDMGIVPYNDAIPPSVDSFTVAYDGTDVTFSWTMKETVADLKGFRIKHAVGLSATFEQMTDVQATLYGPSAVSAVVALSLVGAHAFAIAAVDQANQESIPVYRELFYGFYDYRALIWPGTIQGAYIDDYNWLTALETTSYTWTYSATWAGCSSWKAGYAEYNDIMYTTQVIDTGLSALLEFVLGWSITGANLSDIVAKLYYSNDNVNWSTAFLFFESTAYYPKVTCRYFKAEISVLDPTPSATPLHIKAFNMSVNYSH